MYETLGHVVIEELKNIRKDFKYEIQRLGDRLEKCLTFRMPERAGCLNPQISNSVVSKNLVSTYEQKNTSPKIGIDSFGSIYDLQPNETVNEQCDIVEFSKESSSDSNLLDKCNFNADTKVAVEIEISNDQEYHRSPLLTTTRSKHDDALTTTIKAENDDLGMTKIIPFVMEAKEPLSDAAAVVKASNFSEIRAHSGVPDLNNLDSDFVQNNQNKHQRNKNCLRKPSEHSAGNSNKFTRVRLNHYRTKISSFVNLTELQTLTCTICGLSLSSRGNLNRHKRSVHMQERKYTCKECGRSYSRNQALKTHLIRVHRKIKI